MENVIRWGHFSDLHFAFGDSFSTKLLRDRLLKKIEEDKIKLDFIVITGDISHKGDFSDDTFDFINDLLSKTECKKENIFICCGNHDIERKGDRCELISSYIKKKEQDSNYNVDNYALKLSENNISQFMCGGVFKDNYNYPSYIVTEYNVHTHSCIAKIYSYSTKNCRWNIMSDAMHPFKDGIYNFTPERHKSKVQSVDKAISQPYGKPMQTPRIYEYENQPNMDIGSLYHNLQQLIKSTTAVLKRVNPNNIFQNNSARIMSMIEGVEEKHLILCDRIYNKFHESSRYRSLRDLILCLTDNTILSANRNIDACYTAITDWLELVKELTDSTSPQTTDILSFSTRNYPEAIIMPVIQNYDSLFIISSEFIIGDGIDDENMLSRLSITKKIIEDENGVFFGFIDQLNNLKDIILRKEVGYFCLSADEGYGKTSIMSKLIGCIMESRNFPNSGKIASLLPWLPKMIVVFGKQVTNVNDAVKMIIEQANLMLINPVLYNSNALQDLNAILYMTFEALSKELGGIVIIIDAVDEFKSSDLTFLPESLPKGITVFISARKFPRDYNSGKKPINNIKHSGFTSKDEKAIIDFYGLSPKVKGVNSFVKDVLRKTNGWPLIVCDIKKQLEAVNNDPTKVKIETSLNSVFYRKKNMWKENGSTDCCRWKLLELFSVCASSSYLSRDNIQSYLMANSKYSNIHSEDIGSVLDSVYDQLVSNDGGFYKLKYASFAEYVLDNKTGFTSIELRRVIEEVVSWLCDNANDNFELLAPFYLAWYDSVEEKIKTEIEKIIDILIEKNKNDILILIADTLMTKGKPNYAIERCLEYALKQEESAQLLYAKYLFNIIKTDDSKKKAIDFCMDLSEKENEQAIIFYTDLLLSGSKYVDNDERKALEYLSKIENKGSTNVLGSIYNIISNKSGRYYDNDRAISILYKLTNKNDLSGMAILGSRLIDGNGIKQNKPEGEKLLRKAVEAGEPQAIAALGSRLIDGNGIKQNKTEGEKWLRKAAKAGEPQAMGALGSRLINGKGIEQNKPEGEKWLRKAAEVGEPQSMGVLGWRLVNGSGIEQNRLEGEKWLRKAAEVGEPQSMADLGWRLIDGDGVKQNKLEGEKLLRKAAEVGETIAMRVLGLRLIDGNGIEQNKPEGEKWLRKAAEAEEPQAMRVLGLRLIDGYGIDQRKLEGEKWLRKAVKAGEPQAMGVLGWRLLDGDGVEQNKCEGEKWLRKAAEVEEPQAMRVLGLRLIEGSGIEQNKSEGEKWLRKAVKVGEIQAMADLALRLIDGDGVEQNKPEGEKWLRKVANAGEPQAMRVLGIRLFEGNGIEQNKPEGEKWLRKAAKAGESQAMRMLGLRLINGNGVKQNKPEGEKWLRKAVEAGEAQAMAELGWRLIDGDGVEQNIIEGINLCKAAIDKGNSDAASILGFSLYKSKDYNQSIYCFEKGLLLGSDSCKINLSYAIRKGKYPNYHGTPSIEELLSDLVNKERNTFALINFALYIVSDLYISNDWVKADNYISLINNTDNENIDNATNWWQTVSDEGDFEGDLVLGWLCVKGKAKDPKGMTIKERFTNSSKIYSIPDWLMKQANIMTGNGVNITGSEE